MSKVVLDMGMSLDGFVAGPNGGPQNALGDGGSESIGECTTSRAGADARASSVVRSTEAMRSSRKQTPALGIS